MLRLPLPGRLATSEPLDAALEARDPEKPLRPDAAEPGRPDAAEPGRPDAAEPGRPEAAEVGRSDRRWLASSRAETREATLAAEPGRESGSAVARPWMVPAPRPINSAKRVG